MSVLTRTSISFSMYGRFSPLGVFDIGAKSLMRRSLISGFVSPVSSSTLLSLSSAFRSL